MVGTASTAGAAAGSAGATTGGGGVSTGVVVAGAAGAAALGVGLAVAAGGGSEPACVPGPLAAIATVPKMPVGCADHLTATVTLTNGTCETVTVTQITFQRTLVQAIGIPCSRYGSFSVAPAVTSVPAGQTVTVLPATGSGFRYCCFSPSCPTPAGCRGTLTLVVATSAGDVSAAPIAEDIVLDGCTIC